MDHALHARNLLDLVREDPMRRPKPVDAMEPIRDRIEATLGNGGVLVRLARSVANQLANKVDVKSLGSERTWRAIGQQLVHETERLRSSLRFVDRQIAVVLPKMSPTGVEALHAWLEAQEPSIARTILNAAISASLPQAMAERYLDRYRQVVAFLSDRDPDVARTLANATFMAAEPLAKATLFLQRFDELEKAYRRSDMPARTLAREACRAPQPKVAARRFAEDRRAIIQRLAESGAEMSVARTIANIACVSAEPQARAVEMLRHFDAVSRMMQRIHPHAARSIALSACRSPDPERAAKRYMENYDRIATEVGRVAPRRAHQVAAQAFRSDRPLEWAWRYLSQLEQRSKVS